MRKEQNLVTSHTGEPGSLGTSSRPSVPAVRCDECRARPRSRTGKPSTMVSMPQMRAPLERRATDIVPALTSGSPHLNQALCTRDAACVETSSASVRPRFLNRSRVRLAANHPCPARAHLRVLNQIDRDRDVVLQQRGELLTSRVAGGTSFATTFHKDFRYSISSRFWSAVSFSLRWSS